MKETTNKGKQMNTVETIKTADFIATICYDEEPLNPRVEWDNMGTMICRHSRYDLGDDYEIDWEWDGWIQEEKEIKRRFGKDCIMLPIYMYDHSGITVSTKPFGCSWDSRRVGTIVLDRTDAREEFGCKKLNKTTLENIISILEGEVKTYDEYLRGDVYMYNITTNNGIHVDSCGGYFGIEHIREEVSSTLDMLQEEYNKEHNK